jgi:hypothetical protein
MDPMTTIFQGAIQQQWRTTAGLRAVAAGAWADAFRTAQERQARLLRNATTDANRLAAAEQARKDGDIRVASMIYTKLAVARPANDSSLAAQDRLAELAGEARGKLREVDAMLGGGAGGPPVGSPGPNGPPPPEPASRNLPASRVLTTASGPEAIVQAFEHYDRVLFQYGEVPQVKHELAAHLARQRHKPEFAEVLDEPEASRLLEIARQHEKDDQHCCAYRVYVEAARLAPAPSGRQAEARRDEMKKDPQLLAAAETCRQLQWCHSAYVRASALAKAQKSGPAKDLFGQILKRAPEDSSVYRAALGEYQALRFVD